MIRKIMTLTISALILNIGLLNAAEAADVRVKCEKRGTTRSSVSVDASKLTNGNYHAVVTSGRNAATSDDFPTIGGEVGFDFDSNPADIAAGAERISTNFIQNNQVNGQVFNQNNVAVSPIVTVLCRTR